MTGNLPDDVTPGDIDDAFGEPERTRVTADVVISADRIIPEHYTDNEKREEIRRAVFDGEWEDVIDVEIVYEEPV